jgi:splicing factor 3B subunit 2
VVQDEDLPEGFESFASVFQAFLRPEDLAEKKPTESGAEAGKSGAAGEGENEDDEDGKGKVSKKQKKKLGRLTVAELKQLVSRPDLVEV